MELDLKLPYSTEGLPGLGGQLRAAPDTFIVEEIPLYEASGTGQHLYVNVTKEALTTREVQRGLAEAFDLPYRAVGFAGMKTSTRGRRRRSVCWSVMWTRVFWRRRRHASLRRRRWR